MRLRRVLFVTGCLLVATSARAQLKLKLSGRANTKTVLVEASGMVTATNATNLQQSTGWNGYGDFWLSTASQIFSVSSGITVTSSQSGSRNLTSLTFNNTGSSGDLFTMGVNASMFGAANHTFTLSGRATFQLQQGQTFGQIFGGGTFTTGTQSPPLGPGPILEIMEAPPAEIQVQVLLPGVLPGSNSVSIGYGGIFPVAVRISNIGGGFAENVPYTVIIPGTSIASDSPETNLSGTIPLLKAGESRELNFKLTLTGIGGELPNYMVQASSTFSDASLENNTASIAINVPNIYTPTGDGVTTVFNRPPGWPTLLTPGVHYPFPINATSTAPDVTTVLHIKAPPGIYIHNITSAELDVDPPGLAIVHVQAGSFWVVTIPPSPVGTEWPLYVHFIGQSGAQGNLEASKPSTGSTTAHYVEVDFSGALTETGGLLFDDEDGDLTQGPGESALVGCPYVLSSGGQTITGRTDASGRFATCLAEGEASLNLPGSVISVPFSVPSADESFFDDFGFNELLPELEVKFSWDGADLDSFVVHAGNEIPDVFVTITNSSDMVAFGVPVTVHFYDYPNDEDDIGFAEIENPLTAERTDFASIFIIPFIPPNDSVQYAIGLHRRPDFLMPDIFGRTIILRAEINWRDANSTNNTDDTSVMLLDDPPFDVEWTSSAPAPVSAGSPVELNAKLTSNGGSGDATVRVESTVGKIVSIAVPGTSATPVNFQNGELWVFQVPIDPAGSEVPFSVVGSVPSNGAATFTVKVLSTGPGIDESSATVAVTGDTTPTVLVSGQVFYDGRLLPNWPVKVADGAGNTFNLQADGSGNWGVFVAAGSGPGQASPGAGGGGAPGAGFGFVPLPGADVDLDVVVGPLELSGRAFVDRDGDGVYTPGTDVPFPGLTAYLGMSSATGQTTTTDADGHYLFTLPPDTPGFLLNPAETGGVARAHIVGLDEPPGFVVPRPVFGVHYVPDFTAGILPLVTTPLNALDFVMGVEPNLLTIDPPTAANPKIRWPKRLGPNFIPEFNTTLAPNGWMEITAGRTEDADFYYADLPAAPDGQLFVRLRRPVNTP